MSKLKDRTVMALWLFPKEDFAAWREACAHEDDFGSYEAYVANLDKIKQKLELEEIEVILVRYPVATLLGMLEHRGLENTDSNRARLLADLAREADQNKSKT